MTPPAPLQPEEKLAAIIQKQSDGGYSDWKFIIVEGDYTLQEEREFGTWFSPADSFHTLGVLLDPYGLKAAYGEEVRMFGDQLMSKDSYAAHRILNDWMIGGANSAIDTAFSLLPS